MPGTGNPFLEHAGIIIIPQFREGGNFYRGQACSNRGTGASWHHGDPFRGAQHTPRQYGTEGGLYLDHPSHQSCRKWCTSLSDNGYRKSSSQDPNERTQLKLSEILAQKPTCREIFPKSYQIKPKSDCIYHFPNQSENGKYNLISV